MKYPNKGQYRIRIGLTAFATGCICGWALAGLHYGFIPSAAHAQEIVLPPAPKPLEVVCSFEFPALPIELLGGE